MWEYCVLSKIDLGASLVTLDDADKMHFDQFHMLPEFYNKHKTFPISQDDAVMVVFKYFASRDKMLASKNGLLHTYSEMKYTTELFSKKIIIMIKLFLPITEETAKLQRKNLSF